MAVSTLIVLSVGLFFAALMVYFFWALKRCSGSGVQDQLMRTGIAALPPLAFGAFLLLLLLVYDGMAILAQQHHYPLPSGAVFWALPLALLLFGRGLVVAFRLRRLELKHHL